MAQSIDPDPIANDDHPVAPVAAPAAAVPAWLISAVTHSAVLFIFSLVVFLTRQPVDETPATRAVQIALPTPIIEPRRDDRSSDPNAPPIPVVEVAEEPIPETPLAVDDPLTTSPDDVDAQTIKGDPSALADEALGDTGMFMSIGAGPNAKSIWGMGPGGLKRQVKRGIIGTQSLAMVDRSLQWFKRHQSPDGRWDVDGYQLNCNDGGARCEPGTDHVGIDGDVACTGYAVLCFLAQGYDHRLPGRFKSTVKKGIDWLVATQKADGMWGDRNYEHAIATLALADAYGLTNDPALREPLEKGVAIILAHQTKEANGGYGLGWDYTQPNPARIDASVSGWNVMALKSAKAGGIDTGTGTDGAKNWLTKAWQAANPNWQKVDPYRDTTSFPYTWDSTTGKVDIGAPGADAHDMAAVGALCAVFLGHQAGDPMLESLCNHIEKYQAYTTWPVNTYYLYYDSLALAQCDLARYKRWAQPVQKLLLAAQRKDGCFDGSWDFADTKFHGHETGRLLSTAYCCLALQASYHYGGAIEAREQERKALSR